MKEYERDRDRWRERKRDAQGEKERVEEIERKGMKEKNVDTPMAMCSNFISVVFQ